jgi:hypothetical protein
LMISIGITPAKDTIYTKSKVYYKRDKEKDPFVSAGNKKYEFIERRKACQKFQCAKPQSYIAATKQLREKLQAMCKYSVIALRHILTTRITSKRQERSTKGYGPEQSAVRGQP